VSVVAYDDEVEIVAEPATGAEQEGLPAKIRGIQTGGMTNLSGGWLRGRELVALHRRAGGVSRVLLLTDGLANVGITEPAQLVGLCRGALDGGITTTTIGFGAYYDEVLLREMAEAGGGGTYYIERADQAPAVFAEEIEGLLSLSAQNLTVEIRPAAAELSLIHHAYPSTHFEGGVRVQMGDLYARDPRLLLAEFVVPAAGMAEEVEIAELVLRADVLGEDGSVEQREIRLPIRASLTGVPHVEPEVRREMLLQEAARAREEAREAYRRGDHAAGGEALWSVSEKMEVAGEFDAQLAMEAQELREMAASFREGRAVEADAKYLYMRSHARRTSREAAERAVRRGGKG
jgi:Ca-activated chloride channel homolog